MCAPAHTTSAELHRWLGLDILSRQLGAPSAVVAAYRNLRAHCVHATCSTRAKHVITI